MNYDKLMKVKTALQCFDGMGYDWKNLLKAEYGRSVLDADNHGYTEYWLEFLGDRPLFRTKHVVTHVPVEKKEIDNEQSV